MCDSRLHIEALAHRREPLAQVRATCPEHGTSAATIHIATLIVVLAENGGRR